MTGKTTSSEKTTISSTSAARATIIGSARSTSCQSLRPESAIERKIARNMLPIVLISAAGNSMILKWSITLRTTTATSIEPM